MNIQMITLFLFSIMGMYDAGHPIHISRTEFNYSTKDKEVQVSAKIYIDDFERAIKAQTSKDLKMFTKKELPNANQYIHHYIQENLNIQLDGKNCKLEMIGKEESEDHLAVWVYLSSDVMSKPKTISIDARYLYEIYNDQRNMIDVSIDGKRKQSTMLEQGEKPCIVQVL
jgi:hypothetical protein